ncbi:MAG: HAD-IC family P-type ATPase [Hormoscilla sp.]
MNNSDVKHMSGLQGLSDREVVSRRAAGQGNNVKLSTSRSYGQILRENLFTFINAVFLTIGVVLIKLQHFGDAFLVVVVILGGVVANVVQEMAAKRKLDQIALLFRPKVTVIRSGREQSIDPSEIVLGDLLYISPGDQIMVDGQVVGSGPMEVDESLLTGESDLIAKQAGDPVYSGSFCVNGSAYCEAQKVGTQSRAYQLTVGARAFRQMQTPLQQEINLMIRVFVLVACFLWILVAIPTAIDIISFADGVQRAAVIAGLVPSGLYMTIILAYTLGALRMVGQQVLIQQANAVESLSNVNVLCLDKTGTLTANRIKLDAVYPIGISERELRGLLGDYAASTTTKNRTTEAIDEACPGRERVVEAEVHFSSARKWSALTFDNGVYVLGAPEMLATAVRLNGELTAQIETLAEQGWRVLLFAYSAEITSIKNVADQPCLPEHLTPLGILSFSDELRPEARKTIDRFGSAGIEVKIISGDNPQTVAALVRQMGLNQPTEIISGPELAQMDEAQFTQAALKGTIFGRIVPEQKAKLVQTLRQEGNYVAMIGDGVNDVLSLKQANLAIAMESGSKATRNVADIVLLKDSFGTLPYTFLEGQRIRNGIQDVMKLFMVRLFSVTLLIFSTGLVSFTFPLLNKHSAVVTILGLAWPSFSIPLWAKPGHLPQRSMMRSLLHFTLPATLSLSLVALGVYLGYLVAAIFQASADSGWMLDDRLLSVPRSALVTILVLCGLLLMPFLKPPTRVWVGGEPLSGDWRYSIVASILIGIYGIILAVKPLREFFDLSLLSPIDYLFLGLISLIWCLLLRYVWRSRLLDRFLGIDLS